MGSQKRVLIAAPLYGAGGRETHLLKLCRALANEGAEVTVAARILHPATPLVTEASSIPVRLVSTPFAQYKRWARLSTLWAMVFWRFRLRKQRFDVLYTFDVTRFTGFLMRFLAVSGKLILNRAGNLITKEEWPLVNLPTPHAIIVESELQAQAMREFGAADLPIFTIPNLGHYESPCVRTRTMGRDTLRVSFLGRYDENKGVFRLLDIWAQSIANDLELCFYGHGDRKRLQERIEAHTLSDRVAIKQGWHTYEELAGIFNETDFVVLPSFSEGLPLVLLEAMAHGVPFVATDVGAIRTLADDNPDVLIIANNDNAIKEGIKQMAADIRSGNIDGMRLQKYHEERYGFEQLSRLWVEALLHPEEFDAHLESRTTQIGSDGLTEAHEYQLSH